jgi:hypothetical protein
MSANELRAILAALEWGLREPKPGELMAVALIDELIAIVRRELASREVQS